RDRLARMQRLFVKSAFHRSLYPALPEDKVAVVANGIDFSVLDGTEEKDPYLLINTCSPDRSMGVLPALFKEVKRQVPRARLQWSYGWDLYRLYSTDHPERLEWMRQAQRSMDEAGIESLGHLTAGAVGKL